MNKRSNHKNNYFGVLAALLLLAAVLACGRGRGKDQPNQPSPTASPTEAPASPSPVEPTSKVRRRNSNVSLGSVQSDPQVLTDDDLHDLHHGDRLATDDNGEAELNIIDCMRVYLFKSSRLIRAACPKSAYDSGSVTCAVAGTSLFNNSCGSKVIIQTDTADITLEGTYLSVTYLPADQMTLVMVLKGKVKVQPVVGFEERTLGEPVEVNEGNFILSMPDSKRGLLANYPDISVAKPVSLDQLRGVAGVLKLQPWLESIAQQAKADNISFPAVVEPDTGDTTNSSIDCDCGNVSAGLLTRAYQRQCLAAERQLKDEFAKTGKVQGKCDSVASGPNAHPR